MAVAKIEYKKEFFDRDYTLKEAYGRVWKYARKYRLRLAVGVICGMATAGTLVPFFQIVQPALQHVESHDAGINREEAASAVETASEVAVKPEAGNTREKVKKNAFEKQIEKNSKLPSWYPQVEKLAAKWAIAVRQGEFCAHPLCHRLMGYTDEEILAERDKPNFSAPAMVRVPKLELA